MLTRLLRCARLMLPVALWFLPPAVFSDSKPVRFQLGNLIIENTTQRSLLFRETSSFGAATYDANNDGWPDLIVSNHGNPPSVFLNRNGRTFVDATRELLRLQPSDRHSPLMADIDNDGDEDLFILHGAHDGTGLGPNEFFENPGRGRPFVPAQNTLLADPKGRGRVGVWFDYDNDGLLDLYVANKNRSDAPNRLFHNEGNGRFRDASAGSGLNVVVKSEGGVIAGDIDNDNDLDLLINDTWNRPRLYINLGHGVFKEEGIARGLPSHMFNWSFGMADYNNDGFLDIYISGGLDATTGEGALLAAHRLNFLQRVGEGSDRVDSLSFACEATAVLNFTFDRHFVDPQHLYIGSAGYNPGTLRFSIGPGAILADGRPVQWKDDGSARGTFIWRDAVNGRVFIASASGGAPLRSAALVETDSTMKGLDTKQMEPESLQFPHTLLKNDGHGRFVDATMESHTADFSNGRSPLWLDLDNDSDLDLFIVNAGYNGPGKQEDTCFVNQGDGTFTEYHLPQGPYERFGRGDCGLVADFNRDGRLDLFIVNGSGLLPANKGPYQLFLNRTENNNGWIELRLIGGGKGYTNADAIGAKVALQTSDNPGKTYWQYILGGSGSYCQSSRMIHFGLGAFHDSQVTVYWPPSTHFPNGHRQCFRFSEPDLNRIHTVSEISGLED